MSGALRISARFALRCGLTFCLIVAVLLAGRWLLSEWRAFDAAGRELLVLQDGERALAGEREQLGQAASTRVHGLRQASAQVLDARLAAIGQEMAALAALPEPAVLAFPLPSGGTLAQSLVARSRARLALALLTQERDYLLLLRTAIDRGAAAAQLARLQAAHVRAYQALNDNLRQQNGLRASSPLRAYFPGTPQFALRQNLERDRQALLGANNAAAAAVQTQLRANSQLGAPLARLAFRVDQGRVDAATGQLRGSIANGTAYAARSTVGHLAQAVREVAPTAGMLLLGVLLMPLAIRTVFYYVLAPLAERRPAFVLEPAANGLLGTIGQRSAPSLQLALAPGEELLIQADCVQSAAVTVHASTRWLLDWHTPFTCLAAGLFALTRIASAQPAVVVVSPARDPLAEIALIDLPEGSAMVFQPRALLGVLHRSGAPVGIARHWRLGSLHAWLTLQLRYLVFRGPATLIVKGCRGARVETIAQGRVISQAATLGFSGNAAYSTSRCQTFLPYLMGRAPLLNDRFDAESGFCVYEEALPASGRGGIVGRGLEGLSDAVLKVFGL